MVPLEGLGVVVRVEKLVVANYRAFGAGRVEVQFPEDENFIAVIGANNSGKSSVLEALRRVLTPGRHTATVDDFWNRDPSSELRLEVHLREPLRVSNIFKSVDEIGGFYWRAWRKVKGDESGLLDTEHYAFKAGDPSSPYVPPAAVGGKKQVGDGVEPPRWLPAPAGRLLRHFGPVHHLDLRLDEAFKTVGRGVLARVLDLYREDFDGDHNEYVITEEEGPVRTREAYDRFMARLSDILRTELLGKIESSLTGHLQSYLGREGQAATVAIGPPTAEELLRRLVELRVVDRPGGPALPVDRMGSGYQSLLRLALLETHVELGLGGTSGLYLVEEPEAYLHPHLRRHLRDCLQELAEAGSDVVIVTHDPELLNLGRPQSLMRVSKAPNGSSAVSAVSEDVSLDYEAVARKVGAKGNGDMPFSNRVILCEGQDDVAVVRVLAKRLGLALDAWSITVADCGGAASLPDYASFCSQLNIPYLVVADGDARKAAENPRLKQRIENLRSQVEEDRLGSYFAFVEDLEAGFEMSSKGLPHAVEAAEAAVLEGSDALPEVAALVVALRAFVRTLKPDGATDSTST